MRSLLALLLGLTFSGFHPAIAHAQGRDLPRAVDRPVAPQAQEPDLSRAVDDLREGRYQEALSALRVLARREDAAPEVLRVYARALMEVGRYADALESVEDRGGSALSAELENVYGEALLSAGHLREAEAAFRRSDEGGAGDRYVGRKNLGILLWDRGDREAALELFDTFIDLYNGSPGRLSAEELVSVGTSVRYLGVRDPAMFQDALMAFDEAAEADPDGFEPALLAGELFLEKYRATDARDSFREVLDRNPRHPRALLGQARILDFEGAGGAVEMVRAALETNPRYADAWAFLGSLFLKTWEHTQAQAAAREALETNPSHLGALSVLAASHFLAGETQEFEEVRARIERLNPRYGGLYAVLAQHAAARFRYRTAVEMAARAVALDSTSWEAYGLLGVNRLRTGEMEEGRRNLEKAFAGDPYNPWFKNTLDLLDTFVHYRRFETEHFHIYLHATEADLLGPYAMEVAEEAFSALAARYGATPPTPIRLEIFPSHADFSVRTLGLTGLGALGVSFGSTLVMDSPSARNPGEFNWVSTMWHEVAHAFHLAMTDHRVPRWFTEGLAVHEQRVARSHWGHRPDPAWLQAYQAGRLHPVSRLNEGFVRPDFPEQVIFSYTQASLAMELIETRHGVEAVLAMMEGYRRGRTDAEVFREVLGEAPEDFDETFDAYVQDRWGERILAVASPMDGSAGPPSFHDPGDDLEALRRVARANPGSFPLRLALGKALFEVGSREEAEEELRAALRLFPEYGGPDSPYLYLARIHRERGELSRAAQALQQLGGLNESLPEVHLEEAELRMELGESGAAARALERAVEIAPFRVPPHQVLAELYAQEGKHDGAVLERRAILALDPADRAEAHYLLAAALAEAGEPAEARVHVLQALELAPTYEDALELFMALRERIR